MLYDERSGFFYLEKNLHLDFNSMSWKVIPVLPKNLIEITNADAIRKLQKSKYRIKTPIGIIGTNKPTPEQYQIAEIIGKEVASLGLYVLCGGRGGVMEAVCKGVDAVGGVSIGLLPETNIEKSNQYVSIPLATGIGFARGSLIASSSLCLIAIGGGNGTLSEIASGLQFGKQVFTISSDYNLPDLIYCDSIEEIIKHIYVLSFNLDDSTTSLQKGNINV